MATKFNPHLGSVQDSVRTQQPQLIAVVTAADMRREHEDALLRGPGYPGYESAYYHLQSAKNASGNLEGKSVDELLQITFEALAETRNRHLLS